MVVGVARMDERLMTVRAATAENGRLIALTDAVLQREIRQLNDVQDSRIQAIDDRFCVELDLRQAGADAVHSSLSDRIARLERVKDGGGS
jgi:hypothetical protein